MPVIGAIATVHAPFIAHLPGLAPADQRAALDRGWAQLGQTIERLAPDAIVTVSSEHITNFVGGDVPPYVISTGDANPTQPEFGLPDRPVPSDPQLANDLLALTEAADFPLAASDELFLDHGTNLPLSFLRPEYDIPVVPIIVNTVWQPFPPTSLAVELGHHLAALPGDRRIVVLGTGGISHWVGNRNHGQMNEEFDRWFVDLVMAGDLDRLGAIRDDEIDPGGDGAHEVRTWITATSAAVAAGLAPMLVVEQSFVPGWNVGVYQVEWT